MNNIHKKKYTQAILLIIIFIVLILFVWFFFAGSERTLKKQLDLGHKYLIEQDYEQALASFMQAIEIDPLNVDAYLGLADSYIAMGDVESAKSLLENAIKLFGDNGIDSNLLKDKLTEIQSTFDKTTIKNEVGSSMSERSIEKDMLTISIQPILDAATFDGKNIRDWKFEELIELYGLWKMEETDEFDYYSDYVDLDKTYMAPDAYIYHNGRKNFQWMMNLGNNKGGVYCMDLDISHDEDYINTIFWQNIQSSQFPEYNQELAIYASQNSIVDADSFLTHFGIPENVILQAKQGKTVSVNTEFGEGIIKYYAIDTYIRSIISISNIVSVSYWENENVHIKALEVTYYDAN